jgi:O-antigen ligase
MAGTFAASLLPLFLLLGKNGKSKAIAVIGIVGCSVMTITSQSSTPLLAYVGALLTVCLWPIRKKMQMVRRGIVLTLLGLAVVMKAPVWFVISHIDLTGGSSGYHRAELIDVFVKHFSEWWLIGTKDIASWGFDMWDTQNQYVNVGETGGLVALVLFICMITRCFARIGDTRKALEGRSSKVWFLWFLGAAFFAHLVSFFGVNYFDQSKVNWFLLLAMISVATSGLPQGIGIRKPKDAVAEIDVNQVPQEPVGLRLTTL